LLQFFSEKFKDRRRRGIIIIIILTRFDCVWMQTQKSINNPHIRIQGSNQFLTSQEGGSPSKEVHSGLGIFK
jgi:hypothetical protein